MTSLKMKCKIVEYIENRMKVTRSWEVGETQRWPKGTKQQLYKMNKSRDLMYTVMTIINNIVLNTEDLLREQISGAFITTIKRVTR